MEKLLHERLREHNPSDEYGRIFIIDKFTSMELGCLAAIHLANEIEHYYIPKAQHEREIMELSEAQSESAHKTMSEWAKHHSMIWGKGDTITQWLGKNYAPLPRYEDGEPVSKGCEVEGGIVDGWLLWDDGAFSLYDCEGSILQDAVPGEHVKRPQPKIYDADGEEIKVGDTVWDLKSPIRKKHTVIEVIPDDNCVICEDKLTYTPDLLTHKEPDSLEKLRDDMSKFRANTHFASLETEEPFDKFLDRLSALIERSA